MTYYNDRLLISSKHAVLTDILSPRQLMRTISSVCLTIDHNDMYIYI